jgi:hypothetical protein
VPITVGRSFMTDRITTIRDLTNPGGPYTGPGLYQLRVLERQLRARIAVLDRRVDGLLDFTGLPTDGQVAEVDVLCAAIAEQQELLEEARREATRHVERRRRRREPRRRWA